MGTKVADAGPAPLVVRSRLATHVAGGRWSSPVGFIVGLSITTCGAIAAAAAAIGAVTDQRQVAEFAALAAAYLAVGGIVIHQCSIPLRFPATTAFVGVLATWVTLVVVSTITYEAVGTFVNLDDAIFESVAGFTTTASTVVADPERLSRATLLWRAGTQWVGGLGALLFVVSVLPSIGVGGLDVTEPGSRHAGATLRSRRTLLQLRHLTTLYVLLTAAGIVLFLAGGMGPFDSITYAATTISTGGFANHTGSFAHFDSATVEWAGIGGMVLGGVNLALLFRAVRPQRGPAAARTLLGSSELRVYLSVVVLGAAAIAALTAPDRGWSHDTVRRAIFHAASATSTTGHYVGGWGGWDVGPQVLLLTVMGVGAMSGSTGSGFRMVRAMTLAGYLRRELLLQVHPHAVAPIRVGRRIVDETLAMRMIGYQAQYLIVAAVGAVGIALLGGELVTAVSGAISAVANVGPALGEMEPGGGGVLTLSRPARAVLMPLMLLGRLEIAPVLVGAALVGASGGRWISRIRGAASDGRDRS